MPYIKKDDRKKFQAALYAVDTNTPKNAGELNFLISSILQKYLAARAADAKSYAANYQAHNDCLGVLEGAKLELYRRWTGPYEDLKIEENGDI